MKGMGEEAIGPPYPAIIGGGIIIIIGLIPPGI
jgi:hypothetical protein